MKTLDLKEAADLLKISAYSLREKVVSGTIPGAKIGRRWCFIEEDLITHVRSKYSDAALEGSGTFGRNLKCHSGNAIKRGGLYSPTMEKEYELALGLAIE